MTKGLVTYGEPFWVADYEDEGFVSTDRFSKMQDASDAFISEQRISHGDEFYVMNLREQFLNLSEFFDADIWLEDLWERADDMNVGGGEDGSNHPLENLSIRDIESLQKTVRDAIRNWQDENNIVLPCAFLDTVESQKVRYMVIDKPIDYPLNWKEILGIDEDGK